MRSGVCSVVVVRLSPSEVLLKSRKRLAEKLRLLFLSMVEPMTFT